MSVGCDWTLQDGAVAGCGLSAPPPALGGTAPPPALEGAVAQLVLSFNRREISQCPDKALSNYELLLAMR